MPVLEKILSAVKRNFTIENCCYLLKSILKLKRIINLRTQEEGEECYPEVSRNIYSIFSMPNTFRKDRIVSYSSVIVQVRVIRKGTILGD